MVGRFLARRVACCGFCRACDKPPAPSALPPRCGGLLGEDLGVAVRIGRPHETHRSSRSSLSQNTNVQEATCLAPLRGAAPKARGACHTFCKTHNKKPPVSGGSAEGAGGVSSHSAKLSQCAGHQPRTRRQVCPPPETVGRDTGGPRTSDSEGRGGRGGLVTRSARPATRSKTPTSRNSVTFPTAGSENDRSARKDLVQVIRVSGKRRLCDAARRKALTCGKSLVDPALGTGEVHSKPHRYCFFDDERAQA